MGLNRLMFAFIGIFLLIQADVIWAQPESQSIADTPIKRVIYITLDGLRWQDFYNQRRLMPKFWQYHAQKATFYGAPTSKDTIFVASVPISLPSYQSQMTGHVQPCQDNACGRVQTPTVLEELITKAKLRKKEVVLFASWPQTALASEHKEGTIFINAGNENMLDPVTHQADAIMLKINAEQQADSYTRTQRYDKYTFPQAWHYWNKHQPRVMWLGLNDSDNAAHDGSPQRYTQALTYYDHVLHTILSGLKAQGIDQETLLIVTTDHGRGNGKNWRHHGPEYPESKQTWAFVINGALERDENGQFSTLSVRPTIEKALLKRA